MQREPVSSSAIVSAGYDSDTHQLEIEFHGGRVYRYFGVPPGAYAFLRRASSKGGYVSRMIEGHYPYEEVTPEPAAQDLLSALQGSLKRGVDQNEIGAGQGETD